MTTNHRVRRWATAGTGLALALSLAACGGNVGGGSSDATAEYPDARSPSWSAPTPVAAPT